MKYSSWFFPCCGCGRRGADPFIPERSENLAGRFESQHQVDAAGPLALGLLFLAASFAQGE